MINYETYLYIFDAKFGLKGTYSLKLNIKFQNWCHSSLIFITFAIVHVVSVSSGPPFLKSCVTLLHSNVFAGQNPTLPTIKPIKIYTIRILYTHYAWVLRLWTKDMHQSQWRIQGGPPLFLDQTETRRAEKYFSPPPPPPYLRVWMTAPSYLTVWIRHWISRIKDNFLRLTHKSGQIVLNKWWLWVLFSLLTKSYQSTLKVSSFK